jgi:hypothetical protein
MISLLTQARCHRREVEVIKDSKKLLRVRPAHGAQWQSHFSITRLDSHLDLFEKEKKTNQIFDHKNGISSCSECLERKAIESLL